jgi:2-oxoglutarate ferredoxin oxidoreductase subunit alpha
MVKIRAEKVSKVANFIPELEVNGSDSADLLVVGWGGTYGGLHTAVSELIDEGKSIAHAQFNFINPLPKNTTEVFAKYKSIVVCELNNGQLVKLLRSELPQFEYQQYNKIQGLPFSKGELIREFNQIMEA